MITKRKLNKFIPENDLQKEVLDIIISDIEGYDKIEDYFEDLMEHGCISGMVGELIYYVDTAAFTQRHLEDIMDIVEELEDSTGEPLKMENPKTNYLAWLGFEETARYIYQQCGGEDY